MTMFFHSEIPEEMVTLSTPSIHSPAIVSSKTFFPTYTKVNRVLLRLKMTAKAAVTSSRPEGSFNLSQSL